MMLLLPFLVVTTVLQEPIVTPQASEEWIKRTDGENIVSLELVSRRYACNGKPDLWLIGVAHVADASFYEKVNELLDEMDIVLYESVRPSGSRPPSGNTEEERVNSTQKSLEFVVDIAGRCSEDSGVLPESLEDVIADASLLDRRLSSWVEDASVDAWGRPFSLQTNQEEKTITFWSFGSDGVFGGSGGAADLTASRTVATSDEPEETGKGVQEELAAALDLEFQLDALSYEDPNWFCSDLTIDEIEAKLEERGADSATLEKITGEAFTIKIASGLMKLIPMLDSLAGGGIRETARLLMIELLSMPESDKLLQELEPELAHVIIVERNTELLSDIGATIELALDIETIGVLYGAGHMPDLSPRLKTLFGYVPVEDLWFTTMSVNPNESFLDEGDMKRLRFMLKYHLHKARKKKDAEAGTEEDTSK